MSRGMAARVRELSAERVPFVHATVVRAQVPSSAKAGDDAVVLPDGTIEGFVGGQCAETSVRVAALGALRDGETVLLRVLPDDSAPFPDSPGAKVVVNECLSGGALEIFLQPMLPAPLVEVVGNTPVADALVRIADEIVDSPDLALAVGDRAELLDLLHADTLRAMRHGHSTNLVVHAFAGTARATGIGSDLVHPFFASMRSDLSAASARKACRHIRPTTSAEP